MILKILLVDDDAVILDVLFSMLMELGYEIRTASGPDEALDLIRNEKFDMAFVDNLLGPILGTDLVERLAKLDPDMYFVLMTGKPDIETAVDGLKKGVSDFLRKPFRMEDLMVRIEHMQRRRQFDLQRRKQPPQSS